MIRLMGAVLTAAGCAWLGFQAAEGLRRQVWELRRTSAGLSLLEGELELSTPPLAQLLARGESSSQGMVQTLFRNCRQGLESLEREDFPTLWQRQISQLDLLGQEGQAILTPLGHILGRYESERQRAVLSAASHRLNELADRLEQENQGKSRVCQALGLSGGAFLAIMLL